MSCIASTDTLYLKKHHPNRNLVDEEGLRAIGWDDDDILTLMNHVWWTEEEVDNWKVEPETIEEYKTKKTLTNFSVITQKDNPIYFYAKFFPKITFTSTLGNFSKLQTYAFPKLIWTTTTKPVNKLTITYMQNLKYAIVSEMFSGIDFSSIKGIAFNSVNISIEYIDFRNVDLSSITDVSSMFSGCINLKKIDGIDNLITSSYNGSLGSMFSSCYKLEKLNISEWDTTNVTNISSIFSNCWTLKELDLTSWNVGNVTNFQSAFNNLKLKKLDISGWDFSSSTSLRSFYSGMSCDEIYMNNVNTSTITDMYSMFYGSSFIKKVYGADFDCSSVTINTTFMANQSLFQELYDSNGTQTSVLNGMPLSFSISSSLGWSHDTLVAILNGLASGVTEQKLTLGTTNLNKLTDEEKAIATNKGWTLA